MRQVVRCAVAAAAHIVVDRERSRGEKNNICIEIQSHAQDFPALSVHFFAITAACLPIVCAHTSMTTIVKEILFTALHVLQIGSYLIFLSLLLSLQKRKSF
jgi:hypothetical protein